MFNKYPYTDFHELNLDWILYKIKELHKELTDFEATNKIINGGAWNITKQYQAWTVVFDNNIGYLSLQPVPAGINISNTDYWEVICSIDRLDDRKFIFIGDSYGEQNSFTFDVWSTLVPSILGLTEGVDYWKKCVSGSGFRNSTKFQVLLASLAADIEDKDAITDIYVFGGINDNTYSQTNIETDIRAFMDYVKANYKNARVTVGHISNTTNGSEQLNMSNNTLPAYINCGKYGAAYAVLNNVLADYSLLGADGVHPTQDGQVALSNAIVEVILGNTVYTRHKVELELATYNSGSFYPADANKVVQTEENGMYKMYFNFAYTIVNFDTPLTINGDWTRILDFTDNTKGCFPRGNVMIIPCFFRVKTGGSFQSQVYLGALRYNGVYNYLQIRTDFTTISSVEAVVLPKIEAVTRSFNE